MPRTKVFISYSHNDTEWLERLQKHLKPLKREGRIDLWDDTRIDDGDLWRDEIRQALDATKVAILLVSPDFLDSKFIVEEELPPLLAAAKTGGVLILTVILKPVLFEQTDLYPFQSVNRPSSPVIGMEEVEWQNLFVKVARSVLKTVEHELPLEADSDEDTAEQPWNVPQRNRFFTGREAILKNLHASLEKQGRAMLSGLGGMGRRRSPSSTPTATATPTTPRSG